MRSPGGQGLTLGRAQHMKRTYLAGETRSTVRETVYLEVSAPLVRRKRAPGFPQLRSSGGIGANDERRLTVRHLSSAGQ
jgi:hypothetical protein